MLLLFFPKKARPCKYLARGVLVVVAFFFCSKIRGGRKEGVWWEEEKRVRILTYFCFSLHAVFELKTVNRRNSTVTFVLVFPCNLKTLPMFFFLLKPSNQEPPRESRAERKRGVSRCLNRGVGKLNNKTPYNHKKEEMEVLRWEGGRRA